MENIKKFEELNESDYQYSTDEWEITDYDNDSGKILSVKRTSDGEIFSVGDNVGLKPGDRPLGKIDKFWKSFEQMRVDIGRLGYVMNDLLMKEENIDETLGRMKHIKLFEYFSKFDLDYFVEKYHEWNNQGGEDSGYKNPSYESVLEFLQNNYEDFSTDENLIEEILKKLKDN